MGTIKQVKERFEMAYNALPSVIADTVQRTQDVLLDLNRDQLLYGRDADGKALTPGYTQDPYFKTRAAAEAYLKMKQGLEGEHKGLRTFTSVQLYPEKDSNTPNLLVNGRLFFNYFFIRITQESYEIGSTGEAAAKIESKYNNRVYGLAPKSKEFYYFSYIRPAIEALYKK